MYETYWHFDNKPFDNTSDPRFYYPGNSHQGAMLKLRYTIENRRGGAVVSGGAGLGKSLLINTLFRQLPKQYEPRVHLVFPQMSREQLLGYLADELAGTQDATPTESVDHSVRRIENVLAENTRNDRHAVIAIDEAHLLHDMGTLETMRLLLNFETDMRPDLTLLLVGQPSLLASLDRMPGLEERLGVKCMLRPLSEDDTISYVSHRLTAAGSSHMIFDDTALNAIHALSNGIPRRINRLCDLALLIGFADEYSVVTAEHIESVADELVTVRPE
jgi:type II secretory pathway predicted ATPase ExeA